MSKPLPTDTVPEPGRSVIITDGMHRGVVATLIAAGGGLVWVKIAGVAELIPLPVASIDHATRHTPRSPAGPRP